MKSPSALLFVLVLACTVASGQDTLFFEPFDSTPGSTPDEWSTELETGTYYWEFVDGGGTTEDPPTPGSRRPTGAYSGEVNALYFYESLSNEAVILVTPPVDLEFAILAELRFRHAQMTWNSIFGEDNDELQVYYKTDFDSSWNELNIIGEYLDPVENWTEQVILIPEEAFSPTTYFGFKATTKYGWGVCIDDVAIVETGSEERIVDTVIIVHENLDLIPGGSDNNPVLRVGIKVLGNSGSQVLNSLSVTSMNTSDTEVKTNGVRLFMNSGKKDFYAAVPVDTVSLVSGKADFTGLSIELPTGYTYLWVTYDIKEDVLHGSHADAMIQAMSIDINGTGYPATDISPEGYKIIYEAVFFDDFTTDKGWSLGGDFERGRPIGIGGNYLGNPDPRYAAGDTMIIGTDLSGLGTFPGDYEANVSKYVNIATTPSFDLYYYTDLKLNFLRWLNIENSDTASIEMSTDGGTNWDELWTNNNNTFIENQWSLFSLDIPGASRQSDVRFRINLGPTTPNNHFSGWNIDNFSITGNYLEYDVGMTDLYAPLSGCGHTSADTVTVRVMNFGPGATPPAIPVRYSFDGGGSFTSDTITTSILFSEGLTYTFSPTVDLSVPGIYNVLVETTLASDEAPVNNSFDTVLYVDPVYPLPYHQEFEEGEDFWRPSGINPSWQHGIPTGSVISGAFSGTKAWVTNLSGTHSDNEQSFLTGPCFDFTGLDYPVFECMIFTNSDSVNGADLEYSLDNGNSWTRLGSKGDGDEYGWNWYNYENISQLQGNHGWTGSSTKWFRARTALDTLIFRNQAAVKFRFRFGSAASNGLEGIGIDDIRIYDTPRDVGVITINAPGDGCIQDLDLHVAVTVRNFGLDTLPAGDTLIAGYSFESGPAVIDTFVLGDILLRGDSAQFMFSEEFTVTASGTKSISAFTLLPDDTNFYNDTASNDTTGKSINILDTPVTDLPEHLYTLRPDTVVLDAWTGNPIDTYLWQNGSTDSVFHVTKDTSDMYHVLVDNGICEFRDTTWLHYLVADAGISAILHPVSACEPDDSVLAVIRLTNHGSYTWEPGQEMTLGLIQHGQDSIEEVFTVAEPVLQDSSIDYVFSEAIDLSVIGTYDLSAYVEFEGDDSTFNDTSFANIEIYGVTELDLGLDTLIRALSWILDAGPGNDSYLWQDSTTQQTLTIDTTGWYVVTVQQGTRCASTDSLHVTMLVPDIAIDRITNLQHSCQLTSTENLDIRLHNTGSDTLVTGDTIAFTSQVNEGAPVFDTLILSKELLPGDSLLFTFTDKVDLSQKGSYSFTIIADLRTDLIPGNDTVHQAIEVYGYPDVSLGNDTIINVDSLLLDAGDGPYTYLWQDSTAERYFTIYGSDQTADHIYSVTVTDAHGCESTDDINISFESVDIGISGLVLPIPGCGLGNEEVIRVRIMNFGANTISNGVTKVVAIFNNGLPVTGQLNLGEAFNPGDSVDYTVDGLYDLSEKGEYRIDLFTIFDFDRDDSNNSLAVYIGHFEPPLVDLGGENDTIKSLLPDTLDAGEGYDTYTWNGSEGLQTFVAEASGWYTVTVTDTNTCIGTDSVYILSTLSARQLRGFEGTLNIYPNPARDVLEIELLSAERSDWSIDLINSVGSLVLSRQYRSTGQLNETIDISELPSGIYYLRVRNSGRQVFKKVVIQK